MQDAATLRIVIGLGNEGERYEKTYHNVGSFVVRRLAENYRAGGAPRTMRFESEPGGFMNVIGSPVASLIRRAGAKPSECLIVHDEADLPVGAYKLSFGGGSAGHKGVASVMDALGSGDFWRLRIGVRDPNEQTRRKAEAFVLGRWSQADEEAFIAAADAAWEELSAKPLG